MTYFKSFCFALISLVVVTESYADSYIARGEIYFDGGQTKVNWTRGFSLNVVSEVPTNIEVGEHIISLMFIIEPPPSNKYALTISLLTNPKSADQISTALFTNTYQATLVGGPNGPFEFEEEQGGIRFGGALGLVLRH